MLPSTCPAYLPLILDWLLPPAAGLLSAIGLWVASRARSTSKDALSTSQAAVSLGLLSSEPPERSVYPPGAPDPRKP